MTWTAPFTINSCTPPSSSSPNTHLETDSPLFLPDCLALDGPIKSPQDLSSNEPPGSSRPFNTDWGWSDWFSASLPPAKSPPALLILPFVNSLWFSLLWRAAVPVVFFFLQFVTPHIHLNLFTKHPVSLLSSCFYHMLHPVMHLGPTVDPLDIMTCPKVNFMKSSFTVKAQKGLFLTCLRPCDALTLWLPWFCS